MRRRIPSNPSQRAVRNQLAAWNTLANGAPLELEAPNKRTCKRGPQPESLVNKANQQYARLLGGVLYRNRRGMVTLPNGGMFPYGVGPNGAGDLIGYVPVLITAEMVGRKLPIYAEIECKTNEGVLAAHQIKRIEELRDVQAIAGCSRSADDLAEILKRWMDGYAF